MLLMTGAALCATVHTKRTYFNYSYDETRAAGTRLPKTASRATPANSTGPQARGRYSVVAATPADAPALSSCLFTSFLESRDALSARFFKALLSPSPSMVDFFRDNFLGSMQQRPQPIIMKAVDTHEDDRVVGVIQFNRPDGDQPFKAAFPHDAHADGGLFLDFFGDMGDIHQRLMGDRPHWYLALLVVSPDRQGQGIGGMLIKRCLDEIDRDGREAYVEGSPAGKPLYEKFGFVEKELYSARPPWQDYKNSIMIRPAKTP